MARSRTWREEDGGGREATVAVRHGSFVCLRPVTIHCADEHAATARMSSVSKALRRLRRLRPYSTAASIPHPALTVLPAFLDPREQSLLLDASLALLALPSQTTSVSRKAARQWLALHPTHDRATFLGEAGYVFEERHFDGVIEGYREMLVKGDHWTSTPSLATKAAELSPILQKLYALIPPPPSAAALPAGPEPPEHLLLHLLHLSATGAIYPHVDNIQASGSTIIGLSLGSERVVRFTKGEETFDVLLEPGSVYIQS